jgi:hypothetical protein
MQKVKIKCRKVNALSDLEVRATPFFDAESLGPILLSIFGYVRRYFCGPRLAVTAPMEACFRLERLK